jgi:hypothetical protein
LPANELAGALDSTTANHRRNDKGAERLNEGNMKKMARSAVDLVSD